jgi:hypothetical protein
VAQNKSAYLSEDAQLTGAQEFALGSLLEICFRFLFAFKRWEMGNGDKAVEKRKTPGFARRYNAVLTGFSVAEVP